MSLHKITYADMLLMSKHTHISLTHFSLTHTLTHIHTHTHTPAFHTQHAACARNILCMYVCVFVRVFVCVCVCV